jgi:hypothetical protein
MAHGVMDALVKLLDLHGVGQNQVSHGFMPKDLTLFGPHFHGN